MKIGHGPRQSGLRRSGHPRLQQQPTTSIEGQGRPTAEKVVDRAPDDLVPPPTGHAAIVVAPDQGLDVAAGSDQRRIQVQVA